jgi:hypothetical protein
LEKRRDRGREVKERAGTGDGERRTVVRERR